MNMRRAGSERRTASPKIPESPMGVVCLEINVYARDLDLNPEAESYIQKKFRRLERHLRALSDAKLELSRTSARSQSDRVVAQLTLRAGGYTLRGQEGGPNLFAAVDAVTAVLDRQIRRHKGKFYKTSRAKKSALRDSIGAMRQNYEIRQ